MSQLGGVVETGVSCVSLSQSGTSSCWSVVVFVVVAATVFSSCSCIHDGVVGSEVVWLLTSFERTSSDPNGDSVGLSQSGALSSWSVPVFLTSGAGLGAGVLFAGEMSSLIWRDPAILLTANIIPKRPITATTTQRIIFPDAPKALSFSLRVAMKFVLVFSSVTVGCSGVVGFSIGGVPARKMSFS